MKTINIMPETAEWITTAEAAKILGRNERTVQEMAKDGRLISKPAGRPDQPKARLYDAQDVKRFAQGNQVSGFVPRHPKAIVVRSPKPSQGERALDMVSIFGQMVAGHKAEVQLLADHLDKISTQGAKNLENVVSMVLTAFKAEADANRERLEAERKDARQRWELERQDRLARLERTRRARTLPPPAKAKAKRAHA